MTLKLTEAQISQMIEDETRSLIEEKQQLNELVPVAAAVGLGMVGKAALSSMAGLGLWAGVEHIKHLTSDPDVEGILRMIPEEESKIVKQRMKEYFEAYKALAIQTANYMFIPTSTLARAAEYVPDLGLSDFYAWATGTKDINKGYTVNFMPGQPSKDASVRQHAFLEELNKILEEHPPIITTELRPGFISTRVKALVKNTIEREFKIARQPTLVGTYLNLMPVKSSTAAIAQLNKIVDAMEAAAIAANQATDGGKARAVANAEREAPVAPSAPGEPERASGVEQVRTALTPKYTYTSATQDSVLTGKDVVKRYDKSKSVGIVGTIQGLLQQAGFKIGKDGFFGEKTEGAVKQFQKSSGALQEQESGTGVVDSDLFKRLLSVAGDREVEGIAAGNFLSTTPKFGGKQDEGSADNIPAPALEKKIQKLEDKIEQGTVSKEEKAKARLERMKQRLDTKKGRIKTRQQKKEKKAMRITNNQLQEMILEEAKAIVSELRYVSGDRPDFSSSAKPVDKEEEDIFGNYVARAREQSDLDPKLDYVPNTSSAKPIFHPTEISPMEIPELPKPPEPPEPPSEPVVTEPVTIAGIPEDWQKFASVSPDHTAMARKWIATFPNKSYSSFGRWYSTKAEELGRQFGPKKAITFISQYRTDPEEVDRLRSALTETVKARWQKLIKN